MLALLLLAFAGMVSRPYDVAAWSLFAAKWVVPFALYHLAGFVFQDEGALRRFETFALVTLAYLIFIAVAFLLGAKELVFPSFILDEGLGIHADRARGPFLQAVANGVTLNMLGLIALDSFRRGRLRGVPALLLLLGFPLAILATRTRAVWLSFAASLLVLLVVSRHPRTRRACTCMVIVITFGVLIAASFSSVDSSFGSRLEDRSPVDYRVAVYDAGWQMFLEKPLLGWSAAQIQTELAARISGFHVDTFMLHNTYLEIVVEHGLLGLALYLWIIIDLLRLGRKRLLSAIVGSGCFLDRGFRSLWPVLVLVFLVNASFVVMNYQFVSGMLFTLAGMLAAQNRRSELEFCFHN
jgi:O-antigen ligase